MGELCLISNDQNIIHEELAFYTFKTQGFPKLPKHFLQGLH